jgi:hypothetical protein
LKKLFLVGTLLLSGMMAHAQDLQTDANADAEEIEMNLMNTDVDMMSAEEIGALAGRVWVCGMQFKGVSKGIQLIFGKFKTKAYGTLNCASIHGEKYSRKIRIDINSYGIGPTIGIGYFKMRGISSQISLFNERPEDLLGKYSTTMYGGAVGAGLGYFSAFKIGMSQLAYNVSVQLLGGIGIKVGMEKMRVTAID